MAIPPSPCVAPWASVGLPGHGLSSQFLWHWEVGWIWGSWFCWGQGPGARDSHHPPHFCLPCWTASVPSASAPSNGTQSLQWVSVSSVSKPFGYSLHKRHFLIKAQVLFLFQCLNYTLCSIISISKFPQRTVLIFHSISLCFTEGRREVQLSNYPP